MQTISFSSDLPVKADEILATLTMHGVNTELRPLIRMTAPQAYSERSILDWSEQQKLFDSWILLFGCLPIDRHSFYFDVIDENEGFSEHSTSWTNKYWKHDRRVASQESGCRVVDTVRYKSRIPLMDLLLKPAYRLVFWLRHRNLRAKQGGQAT